MNVNYPDILQELEYYNIEDNSNNYNIWLGMYYMYTTLSTVGFGDLAPRSDPERAICAALLMIGVSIFSIFLGDMTSIIDAYKQIHMSIDDAEALDDFFGMMTHFNKDIPLSLEFEKQIREHFEFRWSNDRNIVN